MLGVDGGPLCDTSVESVQEKPVIFHNYLVIVSLTVTDCFVLSEEKKKHLTTQLALQVPLRVYIWLCA